MGYERACDALVPLASISLTWTNADDMTWSTPQCAETYNLYRLTAVSLEDSNEDGLADDHGSCFQSDLMDPEATDLSSPPAGLMHVYAVTAENAVGEGSLGRNSEGEVRLNVNPCP